MSFLMLFDRKHTWGFMILINKRKGLTGAVRKKEKNKNYMFMDCQNSTVNNTTRERKERRDYKKNNQKANMPEY